MPTGNPNLGDSVLVLLGHGSTKNSDSAGAVYQHAAALRARGVFAAVREAFWKQEPDVRAVLADVRAARVFIVPLFISEGYFTREIIPRELGFDSGNLKRMADDSVFYFCAPVGTHPRMTEIVLARAGGAVAAAPFPRPPSPADTTLFIAGHGTERNENSRAAIDRQVELIRSRRLYAAVHGVFLDEEPRIGACYALAETKNLVLVPFFVSEGMHTREDLPILLGESEERVRQRLRDGHASWRNPTERHGRLVWCAPPVGTAPEVSEIILDRVRELA